MHLFKSTSCLLFACFSVCFLYLMKTMSSFGQEISRYKCVYQFDFLRDTLIKEFFRSENYIVQIGNNITKGFTYQKFYLDSLKKHAPDMYRKLFNASVQESIETMRRTGDVAAVRNNSFQYGAFSSDLYKDYKKNEIRVRDNISIHPFTFKDELKPQEWVIFEDTMRIVGYHSQKAVCNWRGRDWVAWFTPEIPISEGPWKFYGLPGLITKLHDTKKHYNFELIAFQKIEEPIDTNIPREAQKTDRISFIKMKMNVTGGIDLAKMDMAKVGINSDSETVNYDYIERDYK